MLKDPDSIIRVAAESQVLEVTKWAFVYTPENYTSDRETILAYLNRLDIGLENPKPLKEKQENGSKKLVVRDPREHIGEQDSNQDWE